MTSPQTLSVISAPAITPEHARVSVELSAGATVAQIIDQVVPGGQVLAARLRVTLVSGEKSCVVPHHLWHRVRPNPGVRVIIRTVPGKDALRSILLAVVAIATTVFAPQLAGVLLPGLSAAVGTAIVATGLSVLGSLLVNALIPIESPRTNVLDRQQSYALDGWRNERRPGSPVPVVFGQHRMAPPFAASSYTEIVGEEQFVRALFCFGYGPCRLSDMRIGNSPITDFSDVEIEQREGRAGDAPMSLFQQQVLEEPAGVELVRPYPRDAAGNALTGQQSIRTPVTRFTATNATQARVLIGFPQGLYNLDINGNAVHFSVQVRVRMRLNGVGTWQDVTILTITAAKMTSFVRQHVIDLPARGRWQIEVTRGTAEQFDTRIVDTTTLSAIQSVRPEYPINLDLPMCLVAVRIRASHQLNGQLESFNALVEREGLVHSQGEWSAGYGRTPASAFIEALTGPMNAFPVDGSEIDWDLIGDWHDWCLAKGLKYDRIVEQQSSLDELLREICAAGRATWRHDGQRWGVIIDRPQSLVIDHISPRNAEQIEWNRTYFTPPDGMRVRFLDATQDYIEAERVVPWPGFEGEVNTTEALELPGKTDPDEIWRETRRRMYELIHRPDSFSAMQSGASRVVTRGDLVMASFDDLQSTQQAARVRSVTGRIVGVDAELAIETDFAARFKVYSSDDDLIGTSVLRDIKPLAGATSAFVLDDADVAPQIGAIVQIGPKTSNSLPLRVRGVEAAPDFASRLLMVAAAPEIDDFVDDETPPTWDGRIGTELITETVVPTAPTLVSASWEQTGAGPTAYSIDIRLTPDPSSPATVTAYQLEYREFGAEDWTLVTAPAADSGVTVSGFASGDELELRARALADDVESAATAIVRLEINNGVSTLPVQVADEAVSVAGSLGHTDVSIAVGAENVPATAKVYRVLSGAPLDRASDLVTTLTLSASNTQTYVDGDGSRVNLLAAEGFSTTSPWQTGGGWQLSAGKAVFSSGTAGNISQPITLTSGATYRAAVEIESRTAGNLRLGLTGGADVLSTTFEAAGTARASLVASAQSSAFALVAAADFAGTVDNAVLFEQTPTALAAGNYDYWIEPFTSGGVAGPLSGPHPAEVL